MKLFVLYILLLFVKPQKIITKHKSFNVLLSIGAQCVKEAYNIQISLIKCNPVKWYNIGLMEAYGRQVTIKYDSICYYLSFDITWVHLDYKCKGGDTYSLELGMVNTGENSYNQENVLSRSGFTCLACVLLDDVHICKVKLHCALFIN